MKQAINDERSLEWVAETLPNVVAGYGHLHSRWWVDERILVGGSINDAADWAHIRDDFGIGAVLSLEIERSDEGKGLDVPYLRLGMPDDGGPKPLEYWAAGIAFAHGVLRESGRRLYVHCALGNSRSPSMAYAILRTSMRLTPADALRRFQRSRSAWGTHPVQATYIASAEAAIAALREAVL
jgi:hypothetical protein